MDAGNIAQNREALAAALDTACAGVGAEAVSQ